MVLNMTLPLYKIVYYPPTDEDIYFDSNLRTEYVATANIQVVLDTLIATRSTCKNPANIYTFEHLGQVSVYGTP